ncbi:MAG: tetratricopeptide repeat protein [Solirubrobacteraceae bacterium]
MNPDLQRAEALVDLHRPDEALVLVHAAMARDPQDPVPHLVAARAHLVAKRYDAMQTAARKALSLDPQSSIAMRLVAIALSAMGNLKRARFWAAEAVRLAAEDSRAHALLAQLDSLGGRHEQAIAGAEQAVGLDPYDPFAHRTLGNALYADGRYLAAEQALRHALALDPTDAQTLTALGETLAARGRPQDAAELLQLAARADIRDETIHQDMLRYVRRAAWGLATWPIILLLSFLLYTIPLAVALYIARRQRLHRFPPEVRRLLNRRSLKRAAFDPGGPTGRRLWWWRVIVRIPLAPRALLLLLGWLAWLAIRLIADTPWYASDRVLWIAFGMIPPFLTFRWFAARRKSLEPHPFYGG